MPDTAVVSVKGQITIPVALRQKFEIKPGDIIIVEDNNENIVIRMPQKNLLDYKGFVHQERVASPCVSDEISEAAEGLAKHVLGEE